MKTQTVFLSESSETVRNIRKKSVNAGENIKKEGYVR